MEQRQLVPDRCPAFGDERDTTQARARARAMRRVDEKVEIYGGCACSAFVEAAIRARAATKAYQYLSEDLMTYQA